MSPTPEFRITSAYTLRLKDAHPFLQDSRKRQHAAKVSRCHNSKSLVTFDSDEFVVLCSLATV